MRIVGRTGLLAAAGLFAFAGLAMAQQPASSRYQPPRTSYGAPDLQGVWDADFITPLERPEDVTDLIVPQDKAAEVVAKLTEKLDGPYDPDADYFPLDKLLSMHGELRSSWIVEPHDGRLPLTALAKAILARAEDETRARFDNPEERPASERCLSSLGHPPITAISLVIPSQIIQTPHAIVVMTEDTDGGRIVHMKSSAPPDAIRTRAGYSAGRWEGDTLVVETTHLAADDPVGVLFREAIMVSEASRITERFSLLSDTELLYQFTVTDPALYDRPWLGEYLMKRLDDKLYEYACHEGNRGMENILIAARLGKQKPPVKKPDKKPDQKPEPKQ
jgi:hypothetical protein